MGITVITDEREDIVQQFREIKTGRKENLSIENATKVNQGRIPSLTEDTKST